MANECEYGLNQLHLRSLRTLNPYRNRYRCCSRWSFLSYLRLVLIRILCYPGFVDHFRLPHEQPTELQPLVVPENRVKRMLNN